MNDTETKDDALFRQLEERVKGEMKRLKIPGISLGVWHAGKEHLSCMGRTSVENPLRVTPDTMFQVGSISKTITATALCRLAAEGKLDLDAPVRTYLPRIAMADPTVTAGMTTRHLLTHTGGWVGDYFDNFGDGDDALARMVENIGRLPQIVPLGKHFSYNNAGFNIASLLLETIAGKPYEAVVQDMIFGPLGLERSFFYPSDILITHRFVVGHEKSGRKVVACRPWAIGRAGNGVGGATMSIRDVLAYARFHMHSGVSDAGKRVAPVKVIESMRQPMASAGSRGNVGLSWFLKKVGDISIVSHGGATNGQQAYLAFIPDKDFVVAVLTNSDSGGIITDGLPGWVTELWFGAKETLPAPISASRAMLDEVCGTYDVPLSAFTIKRKGDSLMLRDIPRGGFPTPDSPAGPQRHSMRAVMVDGDRMLVMDEPRKGSIVEFIRDKDGRVAFCRLGGRIHPKL